MPQIYEFGPFRLEPSERKLLRGNEIVVLTPKAFDTLVLLVLNSGRLLNKDELISMIWPDSFVEEGSLSNNIFLLRKALGEDPAFIETVPRRGYRFVGRVRQLPNISPAPVGDFTESPHPMETLPRRGYGSIGPLPPSATNPAGEAAVRRHATTLITAAVFPVLAIGAAAWTLPRRAYRFIGKTDARGHGQENKRPNHLRTAIAGAALVLVLGGPLLAYFWSRPAAVPKVSNYVQLTHGGQLKSLVGTDGARLYLGVPIAFAYKAIAEMSISGGEPTPIPVPSPDMFALSISPDGSALLVSDAQTSTVEAPLWSLPVLGGPPRRLGDTVGNAAAWSPDGAMLAYAKRRDLFLAKTDGTDSRKLVTTEGFVHNLVWSPNGSHLQFDALENPDVGPSSLWEVSVDGTDLHRLLPGRRNSPDECCGRWTADGKYFVFQSNKQIWSLPRKAGGFLHSEPKPIQLTSSPLSLTSPLPSKDGKRLFVIGQLHRGELMRYDSKSGQFSPFLGGISAEYIAISNDGQWVAYVTYPESTLWRSKPDGSERLQLTYSALNPWLPRWSPDGKTIAFWDRNSERIYEVSPEGGNPRQLIPDHPALQWDPNWSPRGDKIVFSDGYTLANHTAQAIRIFTLASRQVSTLPGSQGLFSPRWSPDGRFIVAMKYDSSTLVLFDFQTQEWTELGKSIFGWPNWSKDGQYVYVLDLRGKGAVLKFRIRDHKAEVVVDLKNFVSAGQAGNWLALASDDSPLLLRNAGSQDVYALDWEAP